jgi:hypothetical protein
VPDDIAEKLDVLIKLQAASLIASMSAQKDKIAFLHKAGLRPALIAEIVGTTPNNVSVTLLQIRKRAKKSKAER